MKFTKLVVILAAVSVAVPAFSAEQPAFIQYVRPLGMGGAFTAIADDHNVFTFNPAGMVQRTGAEVTILEVAGGISEDLRTATKFVSDNKDKLNHYNGSDPAFTNKILDTMVGLHPRANVAADLASFVSGPKFLGMPAHVGFGALGNLDFNFHFDPGAPAPTVSYQVTNDLVFPLAVAHRFDMPVGPGRLGVGLQGKLIARRETQQNNISLLAIDDINSPPIQTGRGVGSDLGLLYQPTDRWNVGLAVEDFLGTKLKFDSVSGKNGFSAQPERHEVLRPRTNVGVAVTPRTYFGIGHTNDRIVLAADVRDIMPTDDHHVFFQNGVNRMFGENLPTHLHLGAEFRWWFLRFRGGAYQGYPTFGLGIDIPVLKLDYAYYSRELGARAGDEREGNHIVSIAFRFGTGNTESRERIAKSTQARRHNAEAETPMSRSAESATPPSDKTDNAEKTETTTTTSTSKKSKKGDKK